MKKTTAFIVSAVSLLVSAPVMAEVNGELSSAESAADWTNVAKYSNGWGGSGTATSLPSHYLILNKSGPYKINTTDTAAWNYINSVDVILMQSNRTLEITVPDGETATMDVRITAYSSDWTPNTGKIKKLGGGTLVLGHAAGDRFTANRTQVPGLPRTSVAANYLINMEVAEGTVKLPSSSDMIYIGGVTVKDGAEFHLLGNPSGAATTLFNYLVVEQGGVLVSTAAESTFDVLPWSVSPSSVESSFEGTFRADAGRFNVPTADPNAGSFRPFEYYRVTITDYNHSGGDGLVEMREIALFDENGNQVNAGLTPTAGYARDARQPWNNTRWYFSVVPQIPGPGEYAFDQSMNNQNFIIDADSADSTVDDAVAKNLTRLFDGNVNTIASHVHGWAVAITESSPFSIVMHLPANSRPVRYFDISSAYRGVNGPKRVKLEGSMDANNWTTVYSNLGDANGWGTNPGRGVWYGDCGSAWQDGWTFGGGSGPNDAAISAALTKRTQNFALSTNGMEMAATGLVSEVGEVGARSGAVIAASGASFAADALWLEPENVGTVDGVNFSNGAMYDLRVADGAGRSLSYALPQFTDCSTAGLSGYLVNGGPTSGYTISRSGDTISLSSGEWVFTLTHAESSADWLNPANYIHGWGSGDVASALPSPGDRIIFEWNTTYSLDASNAALMTMLNQPVTLMFQPGSVVEFYVPAGVTAELDSRLWGYHDGVTPNSGRLVKKGAGTLVLTHAQGDWYCATPSEVPGLPRAYVGAHYNTNMEVAEGTVKLPASGDMVYVGGVTVKDGAEFYLLGNPSGAAKTIFNYLVVEQGGVLASTAANASFDVLPWTLKHPGTGTVFDGTIRADEGNLDLTGGSAGSFRNFEYYRFTVNGYDYETEKRMYIREIALFDSDGTQVNRGITLDENSYEFFSDEGWAARYTTLAAGLPAKGKFCFGSAGMSYYSIHKDGDGNWRPFDYDPNRFFDGSDTDATFYNHYCRTFEEYPLVIVMHLPEGANPATSFDVASGWTAGEGITRATLEGSVDGEHWTVLYSNAADDAEPWPENPGVGVWMSDLTSCIGAGHWTSTRFPLAATGATKIASVGLIAAKAGARVSSSHQISSEGCSLFPGVNGTISDVVFGADAHWDFIVDDRELETRYDLPSLESVVGADHLEGGAWSVNSRTPDATYELISHLPTYLSLRHYLSGSMMIFR